MSVIFLDENAVDVFLSERDYVDIDDGRAEGLLLSLLSHGIHKITSLRNARAVLVMLDRAYHPKTSAPTIIRAIPVIDATRRVAWPDVGATSVRISDASYLRTLHALHNSPNTYTVTYNNIQQTAIGFQQSSTKDFKYDPIDALISTDYAHPVRLARNDRVNVIGVAVSHRQQQLDHKMRTWDADAYLLSLRSLKVGDAVSVYNAGSQIPRMTSRVVNVTPDHVTLDNSENVAINISASSVFLNTPPPKFPVKVMSTLGTNWDVLASWVTPSPLHLLKLLKNRLKARHTIQSLLDRLGWPAERQLRAGDCEDLSKLVQFKKFKKVKSKTSEVHLAKPLESATISRWIDEGAYKQHHISSKTSTLIESWVVAKQPDTGMLAVLSALHEDIGIGGLGQHGGGLLKTIENRRNVEASKQSPAVVISRFVSDAPEDADIRGCDKASFLDFAGLKGVVACLEADYSVKHLIGSHVLRWAGMAVPSSDYIANMRRQSPDFSPHLTKRDVTANQRIEDHAQCISRYLRNSRENSREKVPHIQVPVQSLLKPDTPDKLDFVVVDDGNYNYPPIFQKKTKDDTPTSPWDYANLLHLLCLAVGVSLSDVAAAFVVNNAIFSNPVELYMKKLNRAIQVLKSRRPEMMLQFKGGPKSYQIQEDRMIVKMRRDTMGLFCMRTMACFAAMIVGNGYEVQYTCSTSKNADKIACAVVDIIRDALGLPCDEVALEKMIATFTAAKKTIPSASIQKSSQKNSIMTSWSGFRPTPARMRSVIDDIERIVVSSILPSKTDGGQRCCQADVMKAVRFFANDERVAAAMDLEIAAAKEMSEALLSNMRPFTLWGLPSGVLAPTRPYVSSIEIRVRGTPVQQPAVVAVTKKGLSSWLIKHPDFTFPDNNDEIGGNEWTKAVLNACRTFINQACESVGRPPTLGNVFIPPAHVAQAEIDVRHRVAIRYLRMSMPTILARAKIVFLPVDVADLPTSEGKHAFAVVASLIVAAMKAAAPPTLRALLDDLRNRLDFNIIDEADLKRSLQNQREEEKARKMVAAANLTEEQREILHEFRKFKHVSWDELAEHLSGISGKKKDIDQDVLSDPDHQPGVISRDGLGGVNRDEEGYSDDVGYGLDTDDA